MEMKTVGFDFVKSAALLTAFAGCLASAAHAADAYGAHDTGWASLEMETVPAATHILLLNAR